MHSQNTPTNIHLEQNQTVNVLTKDGTMKLLKANGKEIYRHAGYFHRYMSVKLNVFEALCDSSVTAGVGAGVLGAT